MFVVFFSENSASIQIVNDIEAEGVAYREEFLVEQEELKKVSHSPAQEGAPLKYKNKYTNRNSNQY